MYSDFEEMNEKMKIGKLLANGTSTTREAKETLNELSIFISSYALAMIKENKNPGKLSKEDVDDVFNTLN
ncbi:hypothetical protein ECANGB1_610 [Enterospora canceri]|uniref:Uncharacterized protein n=1 Tax=Enterospora canceri TaxID=1081671 RepID=A0A1Y1S8N0_9MICR|nr:hypothetical protein ECANGB1_610 [Enterospora canceri]